jgi:hypothetical protein
MARRYSLRHGAKHAPPQQVPVGLMQKTPGTAGKNAAHSASLTHVSQSVSGSLSPQRVWPDIVVWQWHSASVVLQVSLVSRQTSSPAPHTPWPVTHAPAAHSCPVPQEPHDPPHPSSPQTLAAQAGVHGGGGEMALFRFLRFLLFLFRLFPLFFLASELATPSKALQMPPIAMPVRARERSRREGETARRVQAAKFCSVMGPP